MKVTPQQFTELIENKGVFIAKVENQLAAYALTSAWDFYLQWPIIVKMESILPTLTLNNDILTIENSFQYGPVCIDEAFRGQAILKQLFDSVQTEYRGRFSFAITFINMVNERSFRAHAKNTPLSIIGHFEFNDNKYAALGCEIY